MRRMSIVSLLVFACAAPGDVSVTRPGGGGPGGGSADGGSETGLLVGITREHNAARAAVGVRPLVWSARLAATAQRWSDELARQGCGLSHSGNRGLGENLAGFRGRKGSPERVVGNWVGERACYSGAGSCTPGCECRHYTQVVWSGSTQLGCGVATCDDGAEVWTCNYEPAGNIRGRRPY